MRFAPTSDQAALREAVRDLLSRECPPAVVRAAWSGEDDADPARIAAVWAQLAEMGVPAAVLPAEAGGLGLGACDVVGLLEEAGRVALPLPLVETAFVAGPLLVEAGGPDSLLDRLATGELLVACALDGAALVPYGAVADVLLLGDEHAVRLLARADAPATPVASIDGARAPLRIDAPEAGGTPLTSDRAVIAAAWDRGALGTAAQLVGLGRALLDMTVAYVRERRQFGVPVGSFQAVKHQLADALLALELAAPAVARAAWSLDAHAPERSRDVAMAKALASDAAERVAATALQCHGAIAYTTEYDLHLFAKRVWASARTWGDADSQRARVGAALGL